MPEPLTTQTKSFFLMALWLAVKNPSLKLTNDPQTGKSVVTGISEEDLPDFLTDLSAIADGEPDLEVATQLYKKVLALLTEPANTPVNVKLDDSSIASASIPYAEALQAVRELTGRIAVGDLADHQVSDYDPQDGCGLDKIRAVTN